MSLKKATHLLFLVFALLTACFHEGPTIHKDNEQQENSETETEQTDDGSIPTITVTSSTHPTYRVNEGDIGITFNLKLSRPISEDLVIAFQPAAIRNVTNSATRQDDFFLQTQSRSSSSSAVSILANTTDASFVVNINRDTVDEPEEVFSVNMLIDQDEDAPPKAVLSTSQLIITIVDDDALPIVELESELGSKITVKENVGSIKLKLLMQYTQASQNVIIPVIYTPDPVQSALPGEDFVPTDTVIFPGFSNENANLTSIVFEILIRDDAVKEDDETFFFQLSNPLNQIATLGEGITGITITIEDDDALGGINDTQVISCTDGVSPNSACPAADFPGQDGESNTPYQFRYLDGIGQVTNDANAVCVEDPNTGLVWEIKTTDTSESYRYHLHTFNWYNTLSNANGGKSGLAGGINSCNDTLNDCSTKTYIEKLNSGDGLCFNKNWRMPKVHELISIMNFNAFPDPDKTVMATTAYFPNTKEGYYWTATPVSEFSNEAWAVYFGKRPPQLPGSEFSIPYIKGETLYLRAVANIQ